MARSPLLSAAVRLQTLGRADSSEALLAHLLSQVDGLAEIRSFLADRMEAQDWALFPPALSALSQQAPAETEAILDDLSAALQELPIAPDIFAALLAHAVRPASPCAATGGPDICYVLGVSLPQDTTGYSMRTQALMRALQDLPKPALHIHCLTRPGFPWHRGLEGPSTPETVDGVTYHRCGTPGHRIPGDLAAYRAAELELCTQFSALRPRLIMAASNHGTAIPALLAARRLGLPFIYDVRGFWEYSRAALDPGWEGSPDYHTACALEGMAASEADLVFTLNGAMRDELIRRGVRPGRIHLLPNAADPDRFAPLPRDAALAARLGLAENVPVIGYAGSFNAYEGLDDLVDAAGRLARRGRDFRLLLIGAEANHPLLMALRAQAERLGIADRMLLPGRVAGADIPAWYSLIDIAPIPRKANRVTALVSPLKPLEAMAMTKAVVVSDLPPLVELVRANETGLIFPSGDREGLSLVLDRLILDAQLRQRLGHAARDWVIAERRWSAVASNLNAVIHAAFSATREPRRRGQPALGDAASIE